MRIHRPTRRSFAKGSYAFGERRVALFRNCCVTNPYRVKTSFISIKYSITALFALCLTLHKQCLSEKLFVLQWKLI